MMVKKHTQPKRKHTPVRTCVVCRKHEDKRSLTRLVRTDSGVVVDSSGKLNGRGAYLCDSGSCWERAVKTSVLAKALNTTLTDDDLIRLQQAMPSHDPF